MIIESKDIRERVISGEIRAEDVQKIIKDADNKISDAKKRIKELAETVTGLKKELTEAENSKDFEYSRRDKAETELIKTEKELETLREKSENEKAKADKRLKAKIEKFEDLRRELLNRIKHEKKGGRLNLLFYKAEIRQKRDERRAAKRLRDHIIKLKAGILRPPAANVWVEQQREINGLRKELKDNKNITLAELEDMALKVKNLRETGRANWNVILKKRTAEQALARAALTRSVKTGGGRHAASRSRKYEKAVLAGAGTDEIKKILDGTPVDGVLAYVRKFLDTDTLLDGISEDLRKYLYDRAEKAAREKNERIYRRLAKALPEMFDIDKKRDGAGLEYGTKNIALPGAGPDGTTLKLSRADLMTWYIGLKNESMAKHLIYGNLFSDRERVGFMKQNAGIKDLVNQAGTIKSIVRNINKKKRNAKSVSEAVDIIKKANIINEPLKNDRLKLTATISNNSLDEMASGKQTKASVNPKLHAQAIANIDILFKNAFFEVTHKDTHNRQEVENTHRLGSVMLDENGEYVPVMLTVIEYKDAERGNRIYTIKALDIVETKKSAGQLVGPQNAMQTPITDFNNKMNELLESVNNATRYKVAGKTQSKPVDIAAAGQAKLKIIEEAISKLKKEDIELAEKIAAHFNEYYGEARQTVWELFNKDMGEEPFYLPILIKGRNDGKTPEREAAEILSIGSTQISVAPDSGFKESRKNISPAWQTPIETDIFKILSKGVETEEHFKAYGALIKDFNAVFKSKTPESKNLMSEIEIRHGTSAVKEIHSFINCIAVPIKAAATDGEIIMNSLSGKASVAVIAGNISSWIKQYPQSITPFLAHSSPASLLLAASAWARSKGMLTNNELYKAAYKKSPVVRNRVNSLQREYLDALKNSERGKILRSIEKITEISMIGQQHADISLTTIGWTAVYNETLARNKNNPNREDIAVAAADKALSQTQPDTAAWNMPSAMRKGGGIWSGFLRFGLSLNRLFNANMRIPKAVRDGNIRYAVGLISGQIIAGIAVHFMMRAINPWDDKDKDEKKILTLISDGFIEPFTSTIPVPLVANYITYLAERLVTGEKKLKPPANPFPLIESAVSMTAALIDANFNRALKSGIEFAGYATGLPSLAILRIIETIKGVSKGENLHEAIARLSGQRGKR